MGMGKPLEAYASRGFLFKLCDLDLGKDLSHGFVGSKGVELNRGSAFCSVVP